LIDHKINITQAAFEELVRIVKTLDWRVIFGRLFYGRSKSGRSPFLQGILQAIAKQFN
jgi:hypothetical protein